MTELVLLDQDNPEFPHPNSALSDPNGLLAVGGNLSPDTLWSAYQKGIFPWFIDEEPILWWSPDPRAVIHPEYFHLSRSLAKLRKQRKYQISCDTAFEQVVEACSAPRRKEAETWITPEMKSAYRQLHLAGHAHSVEVWESGKLVGGLYGVAVGGVFCGESMFSREPNTSKLAMAFLAKDIAGVKLIDCQLPNEHLMSLGACTLSRNDFLSSLERYKNDTIDWPR
ncbi:leucyl/phenylalanyl-tRNA--protein transferase [Porticoccaceae bacterium LTM1]|nr:leucyl/phenylalanyl-tRNA--protein transferase [Porticoccaceae bacterium LTM1]